MSARYFSIIIFCLSVFSLNSNFAQILEGGVMDNEKRSQIVNGLEANDRNAFEEVSKLPVEKGAPFLLIYVDDASTNKERAEQARATLRKMPGFSKYMEQKIQEKRKRPTGNYDANSDFKLLALIGGDGAARAVAPFLFVDDLPVALEGQSAGPINFQAMYTLANMHLPDAPAGGVKEGIERWKKWAIKKGYRDNSIPALMTFEERGVPPAIIAQTQVAMAASAAWTPPPPDSASSVNPGVQVQNDADVTPSPAITSTTTDKTKSVLNFRVISYIVIILLAGGAGILIISRRKSH